MNCSLTEASAMLDASVIAAHDRRSEAARECRRTPTPIADGDDAAGCVAADRAVEVFPVGRGSRRHAAAAGACAGGTGSAAAALGGSVLPRVAAQIGRASCRGRVCQYV